MTDTPQPWLEDALHQLDLRKADRCLVLGCPTPAHVAAVSQIVGRAGTIVVVEPDLELAELAIHGDHENLEVLHYTPEGHETFGVFDAALACPLTTMGWSVVLWAQVILKNLRPGGRFVLDLPADNPCDPLRRAWEAIGGDAAAFATISGPLEDATAQTLRERGLRNVEASLGTHLLHFESPYALAGLLQGAEISTTQIADLERTLVESMQTTGAVDVVFHRTRIHGLR